MSTDPDDRQPAPHDLIAAQEALRRSEQRYAGILNAQQTLIVRCDMAGRITYMNEAYRRAYGLEVGQRFQVAVHPDDIEATDRAMEQLKRPPHTCAIEQRTLVNGHWRWIQWQDSVALDSQGNIIEVQGVGFDIHDRRIAEESLRHSEQHYRELAESNRLLLQEVDHRVRNNLAALLGLVALMRRSASSVDSLADAMEARLRAMAHVHQLLAANGWRELELGTLIRSLLSAVGDLTRHPIPLHIDGPAVAIGHSRSLPMSMVLLELFTNSCKYGAHSAPAGRLAITWTTEAGRVQLHWRESAGPPVPPNAIDGLGHQIVRGLVARELRGSCHLALPPGGADHRIEFPI